MAWLTSKTPQLARVILMMMALALIGAGPLPLQRVAAAELPVRSIRISDTTAAQGNVTYRVGFNTVVVETVGSIRIAFCSNTPLVDDSCIAPVGFDASNANLTNQNGITGFSMSINTTANEIVIGRPPSIQIPMISSYIFTNITNPSTGGSYFARIYTYPTSDGSGAYNDAGGLALYFRPAFGVSAVVPPYLRFCLGESITGLSCSTATEPFSDVGILGPLVTGVAQTQMIAATNAEGGYSLTVIGGTMTSGNNTIPAMVGVASIKGISQFGMNMRANTVPIIGSDPAGPGVATTNPLYSQQNQYRFQSGDTLATATAPDDNRKYTVSYVINTAPNQPGGVYATTLTYIALANF